MFKLNNGNWVEKNKTKQKHTNENRKRKNGDVLVDDDDNRKLTVVPRSPWKVTGKETYKSKFQAGRQRSLRRRGTWGFTQVSNFFELFKVVWVFMTFSMTFPSYPWPVRSNCYSTKCSKLFLFEDNFWLNSVQQTWTLVWTKLSAVRTV